MRPWSSRSGADTGVGSARLAGKLGDFLSHCASSGASQVVLVVKNLLANAGDVRDVGFIPGLGRTPGGGHGTHSSILAWGVL